MVDGCLYATSKIKSSANAIAYMLLFRFAMNRVGILYENILKSPGEFTVPCIRPSIIWIIFEDINLVTIPSEERTVSSHIPYNMNKIYWVFQLVYDIQEAINGVS